MLPTALRTLPWLAALGLALACDPASKPSSESVSADGPGKAGSVTKTETVTKSETTSKSDTSSKSATVSKSETTTKTETSVVPGHTETSSTVVKTETSATGETKTAESVTKTTETSSETKTTTTPTVPTTSARAVVFYRKAPKERVKLFALPEPSAPDPTAARDLGLVTDDTGGSIDYGSGAPVLSGDGQWLAYLDDGRLEIARVDGTAKHRITKHKGNRVEVLIAGFSPDSGRLMFHQGEVQSEEGAALPKGVVAGFYELVLADRSLVHEPALESFRTYDADGRHVVFQSMLPDRAKTLMSFDLDADASEELQRIEDSFGFSQPVLVADRLAFVYHPGQGRSRVAMDALRGGARKDVSPEGGFAQYQWPHISPDANHVTYTDETTLVLYTIDDGASRTLITCTERHCDHAWESPTTLLVLDGKQLSRVSLEGTSTPLVGDVEGFVVAGAPG